MANKLLLLLVLLFFSATSHAATYTVTKFTDENDGSCRDGDCSLRDAVNTANRTTAADTIQLSSGTYVLTLSGVEELNQTGDLDVSQSLTIQGVSAAETIIESQVSDRILDFSGGSSHALSNLALQGGQTTDASNDKGGAIFSSANTTLELSHCIIRNNQAVHSGGIYFYGSLTISDCLFESNVASGGGAAITVLNTTATTSITSSTFRNNGDGESEEAGRCAIYMTATGGLSVNQSTFTGNSCGIKLINTSATITQSSFSGTWDSVTTPTSDYSNHYGIYNYSGDSVVVSDSSIVNFWTGVYGNDVNSGSDSDSNDFYNYDTTIQRTLLSNCNWRYIATEGYNLFALGDDHSAYSDDLSNTAITDIWNESAELADFVDSDTNGRGYFPLMSGSAAINAGGSDCPTTDQLGSARVGTCDIGAIESPCGNGTIDSSIAEECDDGNETDGDGCSKACVVETAASTSTTSAEDATTTSSADSSTSSSTSSSSSASTTATATSTDTADSSVSEGSSGGCQLQNVAQPASAMSWGLGLGGLLVGFGQIFVHTKFRRTFFSLTRHTTPRAWDTQS